VRIPSKIEKNSNITPLFYLGNMKLFLHFALATVFFNWSIASHGQAEAIVFLQVLVCFSEKATVQALGKGVIPMTELEVGDKVLTGKEQDRYEPVYGFGHINADKTAEFFQISTSNNSPLEMTGNHMLFVRGKEHPVRADSIKVGDNLRADHGTFDSVTKIQTVTRKGVYAPLTPSGSIVVNGIVASTYVSMQDHAVEYAEFSNGAKIPFLTQEMGGHMSMSPMRMLCMGVSSSFCEVHDEDGLMPWVRFGYSFLQWAMGFNVFVQALLCGLCFLVLAGFNVVELVVFGETWSPLLILATLLFVARIVVKRSGVSFVLQKEQKAKNA